MVRILLEIFLAQWLVFYVRHHGELDQVESRLISEIRQFPFF